jgi:hypothetical protein
MIQSKIAGAFYLSKTIMRPNPQVSSAPLTTTVDFVISTYRKEGE